MKNLKFKEGQEGGKTVLIAGRSVQLPDINFSGVGYELLLMNNLLFIDGRRVTSLSHVYIKEFISSLVGNHRFLRLNGKHLSDKVKAELEHFNDTSLRRALDMKCTDVVVARLRGRKGQDFAAYYIMLSRDISLDTPTAEIVASRMHRILSHNGVPHMLDNLEPIFV